MNKKPNSSRCEAMYQALLSMQSLEECMRFMDDLCTITELQAMEQRFQVAQCLAHGMNYNEILEQTGASSATISRVNRSLRYGSGGYEIALSRIEE